MKTKILSICALATCFVGASPAFAMHAYRSMECKSDTYRFHYDGNYPVGGNYEISSLKDSEEFLALENDKSVYGEDELEQADILFKIDSHASERPSKYNDGCFDNEEWNSKVSLKLDDVSAGAARKLNLKKGQVLNLSCHESLSIPNPINCK